VIAENLDDGGPERLIGWLGETYGGPADRGQYIVSWDPRIMHFKKFLSIEECDQLKELAASRLRRSGVSNSITGADEYSDIRTSSGMFFNRGETALIRRVEARVAAWTLLPPGHAEGMQILKYELTQKYDPHHDYFSHDGKDDNGGNRMATVLMYLEAADEGGETVFPKVAVPANQTKEAGYSDCAMQGLAVRPQKGDAVLFWSIRPDGTFDPKSFHGSCPVIKGEKWSATKWIHVGHYAEGHGEVAKKIIRTVYAPPPPPVTPGCKDKDRLCKAWSEEGECDSNPGFMVGTKEQPGACVASCGKCQDIVPEKKTRKLMR